MPVIIFFCYAREDESLLNKLKTHLKLLQRQGLIDIWYDRDISAGAEWEKEISKYLNEAQIILLLVSPDFMNSDYCYSVEMKRALERHEHGEALVIPIIVRPVYWQKAPFAKLQALPRDAKPIMDSSWHNQDAAFVDVVEGISEAVEQHIIKPSIRPAGRAADGSKSRPVRSAMKALKQGSVAPELTIRRKKIARVSSSQAALLYLYQGHRDGVQELAWSPDGTRIASASSDGTVQVWRGTDGSHLLTYSEHTTQYVNTVAWSPDGTRLASGDQDETVQVWDATTGDHIYTYRGHNSGVSSLAWSPDGTRIASGNYDGTVQVWNTVDGSHLFTYHRHDDRVGEVRWSPDSKWIASTSGVTVHTWDATNGEGIYEYLGHFNPKYRRNGEVRAIGWSPDGKHIASASIEGSTDGSVQIWDAANGNCIYMYDHAGSTAVAWSPDSILVASARQCGPIRLWDAMDGEHIFSYHGHSMQYVTSVVWSPDGICLASAGTNHNVVVGAPIHSVQVWSPALSNEEE